MVDSLIWSTVWGILNPILLNPAMRDLQDDLEALNRRAAGGEPVSASDFFEAVPTALWIYYFAFVAISLTLPYVWNSIGWSPAQRMIGLRIVDAEGRAPGWRRGLARTAASWFSGLALGLGYLAAAWHPEKRTWHDRMASTWVVDVRTDR